MPINVNDPEYVSAEKDYHEADTLEKRLTALKKMISHAPKHKGGENLRQQLTTRRKKLEQEIARKKKSGKRTTIGIKKENHQIVIVGKTNSGKSTLLNILTNAKPVISLIRFSTTTPQIGMVNIETISMQIIENPAIKSDYYDRGLTNSAAAIILLITSLDDLNELIPLLEKATKKQIIVYNDKDELGPNSLRKLTEKMNSKKYNFVITNLKEDLESFSLHGRTSNFTKKNSEGKIEKYERSWELGVQGFTGSPQELKNKIFETFDKIRVYTKEPGKEKEKKPVILNQNSTIKDVAEKILKGLSKNISESKIWGPSSKFPGQKVGLTHKLKDLDVVEFKIR